MGFLDSIVKLLIKEGLPGGVGVGLTLPNGYINGAPDNSDDDTNEDVIPGGKAKGKTLVDIAKKYAGDYYDYRNTLEKVKEQLKDGIKVEMEHTNDVRKAAEIAKDHLWEDLFYYKKLSKIEKQNEITEASQAGTGYSNAVLDKIVVNPETGEQIKVRSALNYPRNHVAYKAAMQMVKANTPKKKPEHDKHKHLKQLKTRPKWKPGGQKPHTVAPQSAQPDNVQTQSNVTTPTNLNWMSGKDGWEILDDERAKVDNIRDYSRDEYGQETGEYFKNQVTKDIAPNAFKDEVDMIYKMKAADPTYLSAEEMENMNNTDVGDILAASGEGGLEAMYNLGKERATEYGKDWDRLEQAIKSNSEVPPPIALRDKNGDLHLVAGNTRLMSYTAFGKKLPIKVLDYNGEFQYKQTESISESLLMEGGAAGHLAHPFEDEDLSFADMKEMIKRGLVGGLDKEAPVTEKLDGQNIAFSIKDGKIVFGRNKGHVRNSGENALDVNGIKKQFAGRGGIEKAFGGAAEDLQAAAKKLTPQQIKKMFGNGSKFMSLEIILPDTTNVIPYGKNVLVMHGTIEYDKEGNQINRSTDDGRLFASAVQKVGADKQKTFGIEGPRNIVFSDGEAKEYTKKANEFNKQLDSAAKQFKLTDKSKLADYRKNWWIREVNNQEKKLGIKLSNNEKVGLVKRWADGDKTFGSKSFDNPKKVDWFKNYETTQLAKSQKEMIKPIERVFLNAGAQSLKRVTNFLASNNPKAADELRKETLDSIKGIKNSKDVDKIAKLQIELERLENIGMDKIVPSEGVVFQYKGKPYKFTGAFAPINQINGTFKFDKPKKEDTKKEQTSNKTVAIFTGRFQPFHAGHYSIYESLVKKFGKDNVYISSSNVMDTVKSPFPFKEKKDIMTKMFGIPSNKVVQVKNPYQPSEILEKLPKDTTYVTAVSQKDAERLEQGGKYFKNYSSVPDTKKKGYEDEGYFIVAPEMQLKVNGKNISGTQLRATFGDKSMSVAEKRKIFNQIYPKFDKDIFARIVVRTSNAEKAKMEKDKPKSKSNQKVTDFKGNKKVQKVLNQKIKNPDTGRMILVKTALGYDKGLKVRKSAMQLVKNAMG